MSGAGLSITGCLKEVSSRLTTVAAIARAAVTCAESGSEQEAIRISLDMDEMLHEAQALHRAATLMNRMERDATG